MRNAAQTQRDRLVRAPDRSQADRSFARHAASEEPSHARNLSRTPQHYECEEPVMVDMGGTSDSREAAVNFAAVGPKPVLLSLAPWRSPDAAA